MFVIGIAFTTKAQLKDLTAGGQSLSVSTTYNFVDAIGDAGRRFSLHVFSANSVNDTTAYTLWQSNTQLGTDGWEQIGTTYTLVPSDTSDIYSSFACWGRYFKIKFGSGNADATGKVYAIINYK